MCYLFWCVSQQGGHWLLFGGGRRLRLHNCKLFFGLILSLCQGSVFDRPCSPGAAAGAHVHPRSDGILWLQCRLLACVSFGHIDRYFRVLVVRWCVFIVKAMSLSQLEEMELE